jgi:broad specificity phosphatase PhoE
MTCIIMARPGQTEWQREGYFRKRADIPLSEAGLVQAEALGRRVAVEWQPAAVYSSPFPRAVKTAKAVAKHVDLPVQVHPGLAEIDYGEWQGVSVEESLRRWPDTVDSWYSAPQSTRIPGGETLDDLRERATVTVSELANRHAGETIVLVGHAVINRIILLGILRLGNERLWHIRQDTGAINVFEYEKESWVLLSLNDTCHLRRSK